MTIVQKVDALRDCSLFMDRGGGGVKFSKSRETGGVFLNTVDLRGWPFTICCFNPFVAVLQIILN